jgi:transaldolase
VRLWLDTANIDEIKTAVSWGVISGVTTNPSLVAKEGFKVPFKKVVKMLCDIVNGPVSAEAVSLDAEGTIREAKELSSLSPHVVVKIPITKEGLKAIRAVSQLGIRVNCTLNFSANQALLAARAGAAYVSPFLGRLDDIGNEGMQIVRDIVQIFRNYDEIKTQVIAASIRSPIHVIEAAKAGADIATIPFSVVEQMLKHPLTDIGIQRFLDDWKKSGISFG